MINFVAMQKCPECEITKTVTIDNEISCAKCGYVFGIESNEESDPGGSEGKRKRTIFDGGMSSSISTSGKDFQGKNINYKKNKKVGDDILIAGHDRLRTINTRIKTSRERNMTKAVECLNRMIQKLSLSEFVHVEARGLYEKALDKKLIQGRSINLVSAACIYAVTRLSSDTTKSLIEISEVVDEKKKDLQSCYFALCNKLELKPGLPDPQQKTPKIISKLEISGIRGEKVTRTSRKILQDAKDAERTAGKDPNGLAAAAVYIACSEHNVDKTLGAIADAAVVSRETIRNRAKDLKL